MKLAANVVRPLLAGAAAGFAIWCFSRMASGVDELAVRGPWLLAALFAGGAVLGVAWPETFWAGGLGLYLGQAAGLVVERFLPSAEGNVAVLLLGLLCLCQCVLAGFAGAAVGALGRGEAAARKGSAR